MGKRNLQKVGWAQACRDIVIRSIDKGQAPVVLVGLIVLVTAFRLPPADLGTVTQEIIKNFKSMYFVGWAVAVALVAAWAIHARRMRRIFHQEVDRVIGERNQLQKQLAGKNKIKTSRKRNRK